MDANGNLSISERRALRPGDWVVYQTEATAHRGEQRGRVHHVGESGIVWLGTTGSRYALTTDYVARADWPRADAPEADVSSSEKLEEFLRDIAPTREMVARWPAWKRNALGPVPTAPVFQPVAAPEAAKRVEAGGTGKDAGEVLLARVTALTAERDKLRAQVAALKVERDIARKQIQAVVAVALEMAYRLREVAK